MISSRPAASALPLTGVVQQEWRRADELNNQFHVTARSPANRHRALPRGMNLQHVLCHPAERVVQNDGTVSWCNRIFQWNVVHQSLSLSRKKILVSELLDGTLRLTCGTQTLSWTEVSTRPLKPKPQTANPAARPSPAPLQARRQPPVASRTVEPPNANFGRAAPKSQCDISIWANPVTLLLWSDMSR